MTTDRFMKVHVFQGLCRPYLPPLHLPHQLGLDNFLSYNIMHWILSEPCYMAKAHIHYYQDPYRKGNAFVIIIYNTSFPERKK